MFSKKVVLVVGAVCVCCLPSFSQKGIEKIVQAGTKPAVKISDLAFPPSRMAGHLQQATAKRFQAALMQNGSAVQVLERAAARSLLSPRQFQTALMQNWQLQTQGRQRAPANKQARLSAQRNTRFLRDYLQTHQNSWPVYAQSAQDNRVLRHVMGLMSAQENTPEILATKQEIIHLRAASNSRTPQELFSIIRDMMAYGIVPSRVHVDAMQRYTEDELALGEDLAFALLAYQVPMKNNPWNLPGVAHLADQVNTYNLMRRANPLFESLPELYEENGMHKDNIPLLTQQEYASRQLAFATEHPFEYALAPYRSASFGLALPKVFNQLSRLEKEAILFTAPGLETNTGKQMATTWYDKAVQKQNSGPRSFLEPENEVNFKQRLTGNYRILFRSLSGEEVAFQDLPYQSQVEFLQWAWQNHRLLPGAVLNSLYK